MINRYAPALIFLFIGFFWTLDDNHNIRWHDVRTLVLGIIAGMSLASAILLTFAEQIMLRRGNLPSADNA
jgi:hypothetical protein